MAWHKRGRTKAGGKDCEQEVSERTTPPRSCGAARALYLSPAFTAGSCWSLCLSLLPPSDPVLSKYCDCEHVECVLWSVAFVLHPSCRRQDARRPRPSRCFRLGTCPSSRSCAASHALDNAGLGQLVFPQLSPFGSASSAGAIPCRHCRGSLGASARRGCKTPRSSRRLALFRRRSADHHLRRRPGRPLPKSHMCGSE